MYRLFYSFTHSPTLLANYNYKQAQVYVMLVFVVMCCQQLIGCKLEPSCFLATHFPCKGLLSGKLIPTPPWCLPPLISSQPIVKKCPLEVPRAQGAVFKLLVFVWTVQKIISLQWYKLKKANRWVDHPFNCWLIVCHMTNCLIVSALYATSHNLDISISVLSFPAYLSFTVRSFCSCFKY